MYPQHFKMATNSEGQAETKSEVLQDRKPSKETLSEMADGESKDETDLDQLLDSALGDFDKPIVPPAATAGSAGETSEEAAAPAASASPGLNLLSTNTSEKETKKETPAPQPPPNQEALFEALFNESPGAQQSVADFENVLSGLMTELGQSIGADPQAAADMQKVFESMAMGMGQMPPGMGPMPPGMGPMPPGMGPMPPGMGPMPPGMGPMPTMPPQGGSASSPSQSEGDINATLTDTINRLAQNARDIQEGQTPDEDLLRSLGGLNLEEGDADLLPMVQTMMQSLLSKDILYPSLKEVVDKYQNWLDEKEPTLNSADHQRYSEQHRLMGALCQEYEAEQDSDSSAVKQERMGRIMELIQRMESLGQPPAEIVGDMNTGLTFDENGMPRLPGLPGLPRGDQCSIM